MAVTHVPESGEIVHIPSVERFAGSGVYFLHLGDEVVYVGQAANMRQRIGQHMADGEKSFDAVSCISCVVSKRLTLERYYITKLAPRYNRCGVAKQAKQYAKLGIDLSLNQYSKAYIPPEAAAAMLGVEVGDLRTFEPHGIHAITRRAPRSNIKRRLFEVAPIQRYLATKAA